METLAEYLDRVMRQKNLTPKELAKRSGLTNSYIGRLRNGKVNNPTVETILKLAKGLDVPPMKSSPPLQASR
jgi:transcriptional regulator with XRE-family HTH domain